MNGPAIQRVLIVDDVEVVREVLEHIVTRLGRECHNARTGAEARGLLSRLEFDCAIIDKNLPDTQGTDLLAHVKRVSPGTEVLLITGYANIESAVDALRLGAFDYLVKPFDADTLANRLNLALERRQLRLERARAERALLQADRMASIGRLVSGLSHEINNPLAFLLSNLEFVEAELPRLIARAAAGDDVERLSNEVFAAIRDSREGAERVRGVIGDLRTFARADEQTHQPLSFTDVVERAVKLAWPEIRVRARLVKLFEPCGSVEGNEAKLGQLVLHLLLNAAHAIAPGNASDNEIRVDLGPMEGGWVSLKVTDTGPGLPPDELPHVFEPYARSGIYRGLSLSICHGIASAMGGRIFAENAPGRGCAFTVELPGIHVHRSEPVALSTSAH